MSVTSIVRARWDGVAPKVGGLKSDRVVAVLEQQILSGELAPGTVLPTEAELCEILGVSRTVIRDAVRALVARGLLLVRQGRGTVVAEPSDAAFADAMVALLARSELTMREVMEARATIEGLVVGLAAGARTDEDLRSLDDTYRSLEGAVARDDPEAAARSHAAFHAGVLSAAHQPALTLMLTPMSTVAVVTGSASVRAGSMEDWELTAHGPILDAIRDGDPAAATSAIRSHFTISMRPDAYGAFLDRPFAQAYFDGVGGTTDGATSGGTTTSRGNP